MINISIKIQTRGYECPRMTYLGHVAGDTGAYPEPAAETEAMILSRARNDMCRKETILTWLRLRLGEQWNERHERGQKQE